MPRVALVVDDSILIRNAVSKFLAERGYAVETACNGIEGIALLDRITPALVVVDLVMPKMGGPEFIRELRYRPNLSHTVIIMVAGRRKYSSPHPLCGANYLVYKDIDLVEQLKFAIDKIGPSRIPGNSKKDDQAALG